MPRAMRRLAIFDLGKTNAKMILRDLDQGLDIASCSKPNTVLSDGPYPHFDVPSLQDFVLGSLADFAKSGPIDAIMVSTHGAGIACMSGDALALPVMDYDFDGLEETSTAYDDIRPDVTITGAPRMPRGLHIGAQLHWLMQTHPAKMALVDRLLFWPQFWAHWLSGVATSEIAYAGCHSDLWDFRTNSFLVLPEMGLDLPSLMPPFARSSAALAPLRRDLCDRIGLSHPPVVLCGGHDSSLALVPAALDHQGPVTVLSTGTWICAFALNTCATSEISGPGQMISLDVFGNRVPNLRFMGGEILARLMEAPITSDPKVVPHSLRGIFDAQTAWLADRDGNPVDPSRIPSDDRLPCLSRLLANETAEGLAAINAQGPILMDGPFASNAGYRERLGALLGDARMQDGEAAGIVGGIERLLSAPRR